MMEPIIGKDLPSTSTIVTSPRRLRAGGLVAKEKASGIPYRSLNVRRGNAMRYLVLDYIKQRSLGNKNILSPTLSEEKRKAMENIAANEFFKFADAYTPEEHFFPLHVKPSGELYYIPEKKVKQMLYVVNKLKKCSLESIVSDVTWESSTIEDDDDDEDQFILDFKTDKVLAKANHCELLAHEIEQYYYKKPGGDEPSTCCPPQSFEQPPNKTECHNLRRSISLPIINVPNMKYRLKKLPIISKAESDDKLNMFLADITQHRLVNTRSIEQVDKKDLPVNVDDEIDWRIFEKHVRFASNELKKSNELDFMKDVKPSTSKTNDKESIFYDLIDKMNYSYDEINDTIYREINEVKASICGEKDKLGKKFRLTKDDIDITLDNYNKQSSNIEEKEKFEYLSRPSTSKGNYQNEIELFSSTSEDERELKNVQQKFNKGERYFMEKLLKDERILKKTKKFVKMKRRVKQNNFIEEHLTAEQIYDQVKNQRKRFNVYTLQKLQTQFDTTAIGDSKNDIDSKKSKSTHGKRTMGTDASESMAIPCSSSTNPFEVLSTTNGSEIEMKSFNKNDSDSITDCELSDFDESVCRKHLKNYKKRISRKRTKESSKLSFNSLSNIPIIGRFFQKK